VVLGKSFALDKAFEIDSHFGFLYECEPLGMTGLKRACRLRYSNASLSTKMLA
jgi:hypothetical protein